MFKSLRPSLSSRQLRPEAQGGTPSTSLFNPVDRKTVAKEFHANFHSRLKQVLEHKESDASHPPSSLTPSHKLMALVLETVHELYEKNGIDLSKHEQIPDNLDEVLKHALECALEQIQDEPDAAYRGIRAAVQSENFQPRAKETLNLLHTGFKGTPFDAIKPENRWRMCIDPLKIEQLKQAGLSENNPLLGFMFDTESAYLHGMAKGWNKVMHGLKNAPGSSFMLDLHEECNPAKPESDDDSGSKKTPFGSKKKSPSFHEGVSTFGLTLGDNMTREGEEELKAFIADLMYEVGITLQEYGSGYKLKRGEADSKDLRNLIDGWVKEYNKSMKKTPEDVLFHVVDLCQKLERLHPFKDGNCRTFAVFLMNHLLLQAGQPMTMLDNPNLIDGFSREQVVVKVREGQQRVAGWSNEPAHAGYAAQAGASGKIRHKLLGAWSSMAGSPRTEANP